MMEAEHTVAALRAVGETDQRVQQVLNYSESATIVKVKYELECSFNDEFMVAARGVHARYCTTVSQT